MSSSFAFTTVDVFTETRFLGNPLAIVQVPAGSALSQQTKQTIAREFNLSETVILHEPNPDSPLTFPIDIFTVESELPFAGHPTVGTGWLLLSRNPNAESITLRTKAGDVPVLREGNGRVKVRAPINLKVHKPFLLPASFKSSQLKPEDYVHGLKGPEPLASPVRGINFVLMQLTSEAALSSMNPLPKVEIPAEHLEPGWTGFNATFVYVDMGDGKLRTRMFEGSFEDPATGAASITLAGYLAQKKGPGEWKFDLVQGVEIGRRSEIQVHVKVGEAGNVEKIELGGNAVQIMKGIIEA
ncbi:phenazine biosynthesis PhzF protein [Mycena floridula]|nr:phenazine biosynthesis PhzF protein [Mycena floridula]